MIKLVEVIAPCILMLEEIDKAFANIVSGMDGDSGTSQRVFGTLLTWMQEKTAPVFVVMTANRAEVLPAELIRKGRIDEVFWVDLPNTSEREAIFRVHLSRVRPERVKKGDFDLQCWQSDQKVSLAQRLSKSSTMRCNLLSVPTKNLPSEI